VVFLVGGLLTAGLVFYVVQQGFAQEKEAKPGPEAAAPQMPPPEVEVGKASFKTLPQVSEIVGRVESSRSVEICARVEGFLQEQCFTDGAVVKKGDLLFKIDPKSYEVTLNLARAELAKAQATLSSARKGVDVLRAKGELMSAQATRIKADKDLGRIKPLVTTNVLSKQELDTAEAASKETHAREEALQAAYEQTQINQATSIELAEAAVQAAQASVAQTEIQLGYTNMYAPIDGRLGKAQQLPGALVGKNMAAPTLLATISAIDPMWVNWSISEQEYLSLMNHDGTDLNDKIEKIELILSDGRVYPHTGKITFLDRAIDPQTGTLALRGEFSNPDGLLREGLYCRVQITRKSDTPQLMVSQRAIQNVQGESFVYLVKSDGTPEQRKIQLGVRIGNEQVVTDGLKPDDQVIVNGTQKVRPGQPVKAVEAGAPAKADAGADAKKGN
jgi:membrane fusion protein (multidrug efflux system)